MRGAGPDDGFPAPGRAPQDRQTPAPRKTSTQIPPDAFCRVCRLVISPSTTLEWNRDRHREHQPYPGRIIYVYGIVGIGILKNAAPCGCLTSSRARDRAVAIYPHLGDLQRTGARGPRASPCQAVEGLVSGHAASDPIGYRVAESRSDLAVGELAPGAAPSPGRMYPTYIPIRPPIRDAMARPRGVARQYPLQPRRGSPGKRLLSPCEGAQAPSFLRVASQT